MFANYEMNDYLPLKFEFRLLKISSLTTEITTLLTVCKLRKFNRLTFFLRKKFRESNSLTDKITK